MTRLFEVAQEGLWIWAPFVLGAVACFLLLAQRSAWSLLSEIFRSIGSVVVSPFHYLRKTIAEISLGDANPRLQTVDHYLLRRLLTVLQVGLLLSIFLGAGLAMASAVIAFLPPLYLRQELTSNRDQLAKVEASLKQDSDTVAKQDSDWSNRRDGLIRQAQQEENRRKENAQAALRADESNVTSSDGIRVLDTLKNFFATRGNEYGALDQAKAFVQRMPISDPETKALISYCDHWRELESFSGRTPKTLDQIREEVQPDHATLVQSVSDERAQFSHLLSIVSDLQDQVNSNYHPGRFVLALIVSLFLFILYVWAAGAGIEMFSMALYLSNDVKQIRTQGERTPAYN